MALGSILGAVGIGASLLGGKADKESKERTGFDALPAEVQEAYLKTYLPAVLNQFEQPRQQIPMARAEKPTDIFGSQELYKYQQFKDAQRLRGTLQNQQQPVAPQQDTRAGLNQDDFNALITSIVPGYVGNNSIGRQPQKTSQDAGRIQQEQALREAFQRFLGGE